MMADDIASSQTLRGSSPAAVALDLSALPPIFVSDTHFDMESLHELEEELTNARANLTYDLFEARIVLSKVTKKARVQFDLRSKGLWTKEYPDLLDTDEHPHLSRPLSKKRRRMHSSEPKASDTATIVIDDSSTESGTEVSHHKVEQRSSPAPAILPSDTSLVNVVRLGWFRDSIKSGTALPLQNYITFSGQVVSHHQAQ